MTVALKRMALHMLVQISIASVLAAMLVTLLQAVMPDVEGKLFPVATAYDVTFLDTPSQNSTVIEGYMDKKRQCDFLAMRAYLHDTNGNRVLANLDVKETVKLRTEGRWPWGPWTVNIPIFQAASTLLIETDHKCHPLWLTRTVFYDATIKQIP